MAKKKKSAAKTVATSSRKAMKQDTTSTEKIVAVEPIAVKASTSKKLAAEPISALSAQAVQAASEAEATNPDEQPSDGTNPDDTNPDGTSSDGTSSNDPNLEAAAAASSDPPSAEGWSIVFQAKMLTNKEEPLQDLSFIVQYYDLHTGSWAELLPATELNDTEFEAIFPLSQFEWPDEDLQNKIINWMQMGAFPLTRLVEAESASSPEIQVVGTGSIIQPDEASMNIYVDYGSKWVLPSSIEQTREEANEWHRFYQASTARPEDGHPLHKGMLAALSMPDAFTEFQLGMSTIVIDNGGSSSGGNGTGYSNGSGTNDDGTSGSGDDSTTVFLLQQQMQVQQIELDKLNTQLGAQTEIVSSQNDMVHQLQSEAKAKDAEIAQLQAALAATAAPAAQLNTVYTQIVNEVEQSTNQLAESNFALANLKLNLKTTAKNSDDGIYISLVDAAAAQTTSDAAISDLTVEIAQLEPSFPTSALVTPLVTGLTETACRQRLASFGLKQRAIYQASSTQVVGQAFKQIPAAGEDILPNQEVTVIFAKEENTFN